MLYDEKIGPTKSLVRTILVQLANFQLIIIDHYSDVNHEEEEELR